MKYIKNINPQSSESAYLEHSKEVFDLHFNHIPSRIPIGEVILLTQKINNIRYFTHLVSPIKSKLENNGDEKFNNVIQVKCLACAQKSIPVSDTLMKKVRTGGYTSGKIVPLENMDSFESEKHKEKFVEEIYEKFQKFF